MDRYRLEAQDIEAWGYLLQQRPALSGVQVTAVVATPITATTTRYLLSLADHPEPISFVGQTVTATEAIFYADCVAPPPPSTETADSTPPAPWPLPQVWFSQPLSDDTGWVVFDELPPPRPPTSWRPTDLVHMVTQLVQLQVAFWEGQPGDCLAPWLFPTLLGERVLPTPIGDWRRQVYYLTHSFQPTAVWEELGERPWAEMGQLSEALQTAEAHLPRWRAWLEPEHWQAAETLLTHPELFLTPLRETPYTLLHGRPGVENWSLNWWDEAVLLDWSAIGRGPGICDLVYFIEDCRTYTQQLSSPQQVISPTVWPQLEETLVDTYFLQLAAQLPNDSYHARHLRRYALPAAQCLHTLAYRLPQLLEKKPPKPPFAPENDRSRRQQSTRTMRPDLQTLFNRFLYAYKLLCM